MLLILMFTGMPFLQGFTQAPVSYNSAELFLKCKKLNVLGSVLYIAAHPDDENTRLLAYLAKEKMYRTGYLSMTRGDGGQNLIGDEQGVELGLIRTQELLAARRIDGAEQFFTRAFDFGFTKSTEEALKTWDKEKILSDVVWMIRKFQPDVVITRFPEDGRAGDGHHSASAVLAHEAFIAAADPARFPEQFKLGVKPWQAKRLLWNGFNFGGVNTTSEDQFKIDVGVYNAVLGKSYGEIAAESRSQHKSQGFGVPRSRGESFEYFSPTIGDAPQKELMEGVETSWERVEGGESIRISVDQLIKHFSLTRPEQSLPELIGIYRRLLQLKEGYWKDQKLREVKELVLACSGLWLEASVNKAYVAQGDSLLVSINMINRSGVPVTVKNIRLNGKDSVFGQSLAGDKNYYLSEHILIPANEPVTQPYWLEEEMSPGSFNVKDPLLIGNAQRAPAFEANFNVLIGGEELNFARPVQYKFTDPVKGELYQPLTVLPAFTGSVDPRVLLFPSNEMKSFEVKVKSESNRDGQPGIGLANTGTIVLNQGDRRNNAYLYSARPQNSSTAVFNAGLVFTQNDKESPARELKTILYDHIPRIDYFAKASIKFVVADCKTAGRHIGYIEGAGDKVPQALEQMGYEVVILKEKDISPGNLKQFDAILTGVRAYNVHEWLLSKYDLLMDYIKEGGNLIVQYNTGIQAGSGPARTRIAPYPFIISRGRVTDEHAAVNFLLPGHPVLNYPNPITEKDFDGWIQERGIYFAEQADPAYEQVFSMKDPGESEQKGSLLIAGYGKGKFVYTGLVFFRELPAGVPGAYRLLANIIALNQRKAF